jgi:thiamine-phosphate pyrophosphorylase
VNRLPPACLALVTASERLVPDARTAHDRVRALQAQVDEAVGAGVDLIQFREPDLGPADFIGLVRWSVRRARGGRTLILVNDNVQVAAAGGAHGVHLKSVSDRSAARVRASQPEWIVGQSVHEGQGVDAETPVDYWMVGTIFPSRSKGPGARAAGLDLIRRVAADATVPVLAIGGIAPDRAASCLQAGAGGVAAIGVFLPPGREPESMGVSAAVQAFRHAMVRQDRSNSGIE